ncbi:MAG: phosphate ABC transporter permease subunit PstC [Planctomycetota bacterium]
MTDPTTPPAPATNAAGPSNERFDYVPRRLHGVVPATTVFMDVSLLWIARACAAGIVLVLLYVVYVVSLSAVPAMQRHGLEQLLTTDVYDVNKSQFGLAAPILGTIYSSMLALGIATIFGVSIAIVLSQDFLPRWVVLIVRNIVELLAAIPSVVYGLWGIFVLIPYMQDLCGWLGNNFGWLPFFQGTLVGRGMLPAALVLGIMVLPTISSVSYQALRAVPTPLKEASYALGASRWSTILRVTLPTAGGGIFGAVVLGFGRALGETMALAMLLGNVNRFSISLFEPGNTLAALIANTFPESGEIEKDVLIFGGLVLLTITLIVNIIGTLFVQLAGGARRGGH